VSGDIIGTAIGWILTFIQMLPSLISQIFGN